MTEKPTYEDMQRRIEELESELRTITPSDPVDLPSPSTSAEVLSDQLNFQKTLFNTIPSPFFYKDKKGRYLGCNRAFSSIILGVAPEIIIGCSVYDLPDLIPKKLADVYFKQDQALFKNPGLQVYEARVKCADGALRDFIFYKSTYQDHAGNVAGILGLMLDVTDKNEIQIKLKESEEKYRSMMESMSDAVYICSPELDISYMNPKMVEQVGYNATGEKCYKVLHGLEKRCSWCTFDKVAQGNITEAEVKSPKDERTYIVSNSPIYNQDGSVSKMTIYRDITGRIKLEQELLMAKKLEAAGVFAGGIAHDYNNLLFIILGNIMLLKDDWEGSAAAMELVDDIEEAAKKAAALTKRLLAFTQNESLTLERVDINQIIQELAEGEKDLNKYPVRLQLLKEPLHACADGSLITRALNNIIENSRDALGEKGTISIKAEQVVVHETSELVKTHMLEKPGEYVRIAVSDNGSGIDDKIAPHIFDPYFSTKEKGVQKGLGLGLSTSYSIIKKHGGALRLESTAGATTTLSLYLPLDNL